MSNSRDFITTAESECLSQIEHEQRNNISQEVENIQQILWMNFQDSAKFTASLYKDRSTNPNNLLYQFQTCAIAVTRLYKDSLDAVDRAFELGQQCGSQTCKRDIASFAKRKKRKINRIDLLRHLTKRQTTVSSDNDSDDLSGVLSTLGVASPRTSPPGQSSSSGEGSGMSSVTTPPPPHAPHTPPHSSTFLSRKRKASSLFDEFLETVHSSKRNKS